MKQNDSLRNQSRFEHAVSGMQIPDGRKSGNCVNASWFLRNGAIMNRNHPRIDDAIVYAQRLAV